MEPFGEVYTKGRIVTKQDKFYPGGSADNFTGFAECDLLKD